MTTDDADSIGRRSRLRATSTGKRVSPTSRDLIWFAKLAEHGPLPSSFLLTFSQDTHASDKRARERLADLFHEDKTPDGGPYLCRPPQQFRTIDSRFNPLVYDLAPAAWRALARQGIERSDFAHPSGPWLHRFMTSCITSSLELATLRRPDLTFIPQSKILARTGATLRHPVTYAESDTLKAVTRDIIPDALCGLIYHTPRGDRFRFFAVEADRATEPVAATRWNRKSFVRNLAQYEAYVERGAYRQHLNLRAPLLVLHVVSDPQRLERMVAFITNEYPEGNSYMLFQAWQDFSPVFRPPEPSPALLNDGWARGGLAQFQIDQL